ncbi:MAG: hypothetical protein IH865_04890 [Chloroflexi bacterium]|nr:hypothetical protein [Chloroflexota bacterium]
MEVVRLGYLLFGLADWRDVIVIAVGSLTLLVLVAILVFTVVLGLLARSLLGTVRRVLNDDVSPLISSARETVHTVKGTATFVSEKAASPIIRVYGVVSGARRAVAVITGITRRRDDQ